MKSKNRHHFVSDIHKSEVWLELLIRVYTHVSLQWQNLSLSVQESLYLPTKTLTKGEVVNNDLRSQLLKRKGLEMPFLLFNPIWSLLFGTPSLLLPKKSSL